MSDISIFTATDANHQAVTELFEQYRNFYKKPADIEKASEFILARLTQQDSTIILAEINNKACGFVQLYPCFSSTNMQKMYILNDLYVSQEQRKLSVATQLMNAAKDFATAQNAQSLKLCTAIDNHKAKSLYLKLGYKKIESFDHYLLTL